MLLLTVATVSLGLITGWLGSTPAAWTFGLASVAGFILYVAARLGGTAWVGHGSPASLTIAIVALAVVSGGGLGAPVLVALPLIPVMAFFAVGRNAAIGWTVPTLLIPIALLIAAPWIPPPVHSATFFRSLHVVALILSTLVFSAFSVYYAHQITQREKALERARREAESANTAKSLFLAAMSHEIRTPLGGIIGIAELMEGHDLTDEQREMMGLVGRSGTDLLALLDQILDMSRIEQGRLDLEQRPVCLAHVLADLVHLHRPAAEARGVQLSLVVETRADGWTEGDPLRLRQIAQNLVGNALKFTHEGEIVVRLSRGADDSWVLRVKDSGIGIDAEALPHLFDAFRQAEQGTARQYGGSGLGLSIVARLAGLMGGTVHVDSAPGEGSEFMVRLPLVDLPAPVVAAAEAPDSGTFDLGFHLLVVDDHPINRLVLARLGESLGCTVELAEDGPTAIAMAMEQSFDVICMDVQMPGMDGLEATRRILENEAVPVLALTASATERVLTEALEVGMLEVLTKPVEAARLADALSGAARTDTRARGARYAR